MASQLWQMLQNQPTIGQQTTAMVGDRAQRDDIRRENSLAQLLQPIKEQIAPQQMQQQFGDEQRQRLGQAATVFRSALGTDYAQLPPEQQSQRWMAAKGAAQQAGFDLSPLPDQPDQRWLNIADKFASVNMRPKGGDNIGTYNPRDYTTESWANFLKTGDASKLQRFANQQTVDIGGVPHVFDPARGGYYPATVSGGTSGGQSAPPAKPVTASDVAGNRQTIVAAEEGARLGAQAEGAAGVEFEKKLGAEGAKVYAKLQNAAQEASAFIPRLEALKTLASNVETGRWTDTKVAAKRFFGADVANEEELNAKLMSLAQDILNQQTGTKTDFDFKVAMDQSASLGKGTEANRRLIDALIERQTQAVTFADQAKAAYEQSGPQGVLDMRYAPQTTGKTVNWSDL